MQRPEGPAAVSLGKDRNIAMILRSVGIEMSVSPSCMGGAKGQSFSGCLERSMQFQCFFSVWCNTWKQDVVVRHNTLRDVLPNSSIGFGLVGSLK